MSPVRDLEEMTRLDQAGNGDAGGNRAHQTCGELAECRKPALQNQFDATKRNKIATLLNHTHQFKIPAHLLNRSRSANEINKDRSSVAEMVDVMDTLLRVISIIEQEVAKNLTILQKGIDTRNTNNATVLLITKEKLSVNSFQQTVSMMRRTTEQINDVSRGNTAALVGIEQFTRNVALLRQSKMLTTLPTTGDT